MELTMHTASIAFLWALAYSIALASILLGIHWLLERIIKWWKL